MDARSLERSRLRGYLVSLNFGGAPIVRDFFPEYGEAVHRYRDLPKLGEKHMYKAFYDRKSGKFVRTYEFFQPTRGRERENLA